jgi:transcription elongation factor Elf1
MIPPLFRRCPECGHWSWSGRFPVVAAVDERSLVECPACGHRFEPADNLMRN